ncbi:MAG TPA: hypothetical protein DIV79_00480 [Opitutae bacterium]|nr:hypothetical protein [Opitutaceae bacterium]HCR28477.1 hypothetical protein [Opitutae bacterium]
MIAIFKLSTNKSAFLKRALYSSVIACQASLAQIDPQTGIPTVEGETQGPTLGEVITSIAEKSAREASDFEQMAQMTLQIGQSAMQQGQRIPDTSIWDGIHAVDAGEVLASSHTDWKALRTELEKLLEEPPQDQSQDQQENQEQEEEQESEQQESQNDQQNDSGDQDSEQGERQDSSEQQNSEENGEQDSSEQNQQEQNGSEEQQNSGESGQQSQQQQERIGDMDDSANAPELDQERSQEPKQETREVGGEQAEQAPRSAKEAMTLQQLEQLKQQDKPGALHMLLQNAEQSDQPANRKSQKDW